MAEGVLRHYGSEMFEVHSAGTQPSQVNPIAIQVMQEIGIDISEQRSKGVSQYLGQYFDYVITVCDNAKESCPIFPSGGVRRHWEFPDPPHQKQVSDAVVREFRKVRDMIYKKFKHVADTGCFE